MMEPVSVIDNRALSVKWLPWKRYCSFQQRHLSKQVQVPGHFIQERFCDLVHHFDERRFRWRFDDEGKFLLVVLVRFVTGGGLLTHQVGGDLQTAYARVERIVGSRHVLQLPGPVQSELLVSSFGSEDVPDRLIVEMDEGLDVLEARELLVLALIPHG